MKVTPKFDDLKQPDPLLNHLDQLQNRLEAESNPFPVDAFPEPIQEIFKSINETLNFPIDFIGASILYAASVAIGNTFRAEIFPGFDQNAVLYIVIVSKRGKIKSHPLNWALKPIAEKDNSNYELFEKKNREFEKVVSKPKKERLENGFDDPIKPIWKQHLVSDFTPEALATVHKFNKRGLGVHTDELATWFKNFNRYNKGSEQEFWISVWSGSTIKINRKTSDPINIALPFICVAGTIQTGLLKELAANRIENGVLDRLLFAFPDNLKKKPWSKIKLPQRIIDNYNMIISNLLEMMPEQNDFENFKPQVLNFAPQAEQIVRNWQSEIAEKENQIEDEVLSGINAKMESYVIRFSLIIELIRFACGQSNKGLIGIEAVQGALKLVDYFTKSALKVHSIISDANPIEQLPGLNQNIYCALPDTFTTGKGVKIAESMGMPERTFKNFLNDKKLFNRIAYGEYEKIF